MDWTTEPRPGKTIVKGAVDGQVVVVLEARPRFGKPGQGIDGWTISKLVIAEPKRGDAAFTTEMIPEIINQVKGHGWVTDDELLEYHWEEDGIHAGSLRVHIPLELRERLLAQRVVMRSEVDKIAEDRGVEVAEPLTESVAEVVAWQEAVDAG